MGDTHQSHSRPLLAAVAAFLMTAAPSAAQERVFALATPAWTVAEPFTRIAGVGTLADGRLLISDSRERRLALISRDGRDATAFASQGEGPHEYRLPFVILRAPGDTLLVYDAGNRRYLRVSPAGQLLADIAIPVEFLAAGGLAPPRGIDASGAVYWISDLVGGLDGMPKRNERSTVKRWRSGDAKADTVAYVRDHAARAHANQFHPFAERDLLVVARDGRVGVLSAAEYRLSWYRDGRQVSAGPSVPYDAVAVTAADRAALRRERAASPAGMARTGPSIGGAPAPEMVRRIEEAFPDRIFPEKKPPFVEDGGFLSPGEDLWVVRSGAFGEQQSRVDLLTPRGERRGWLALPPGRRIVALAPEGIYLARTDDDGLEWLERYRWPAGLR